MILNQSTDLTPLSGQRVVINHVRAARITTIRHGAESTAKALQGGVSGDCVEDPHGDCRGGNSAFWWPYGTDLTVEAPA